MLPFSLTKLLINMLIIATISLTSYFGYQYAHHTAEITRLNEIVSTQENQLVIANKALKNALASSANTTTNVRDTLEATAKLNASHNKRITQIHNAVPKLAAEPKLNATPIQVTTSTLYISSLLVEYCIAVDHADTLCSATTLGKEDLELLEQRDAPDTIINT